jgi:hypothetical protein
MTKQDQTAVLDIAEHELYETEPEAVEPEAPARINGKIKNLREHILTVKDLKEQMVPVPDWGVTLLVRGLTGDERADFQQQITVQTPGAQAGQPVQINWKKFWADLVILTARDPEDGSLIFTKTDRAALLAKAASALEQVASVARKLSGLDDNGQAAAKSETDED